MIALGEITVQDLRRDEETQNWFPLGYDLFSFDDGESYRVILKAAPFEVMAFVGTWCPDCQDHLPGFVRIMDSVRATERLRIYALDRAKTYPGGEELIERLAIRRLPTFVFMRGGKEIGRITETPERSLLADTARIVLS